MDHFWFAATLAALGLLCLMCAGLDIAWLGAAGCGAAYLVLAAVQFGEWRRRK